MHMRGPALNGTQEPIWEDRPSLFNHLPIAEHFWLTLLCPLTLMKICVQLI